MCGGSLTTKLTLPLRLAGAICRSWKRACSVWRGDSIHAFDFEPLAASFKRIKNILRQADFTGGAFSPALLESGPESELFEEIQRSAGLPIENAIGALRPKVDLFFDKVLVNAPDPAVRANRLAMLHGLLEQVRTFADFSGDCHELIGEDDEKICLPVRSRRGRWRRKNERDAGRKRRRAGGNVPRAPAGAAGLHHLDGSLQHLFREPEPCSGRNPQRDAAGPREAPERDATDSG